MDSEYKKFTSKLNLSVLVWWLSPADVISRHIWLWPSNTESNHIQTARDITVTNPHTHGIAFRQFSSHESSLPYIPKYPLGFVSDIYRSPTELG